MVQFLGPETDRMCQFLGPESDVMGERYYISTLFMMIPSDSDSNNKTPSFCQNAVIGSSPSLIELKIETLWST
jgi:hypothetical protein